MMQKSYFRFLLSAVLLGILMLSPIQEAAAQDEYGAGGSFRVPKVAPGTIRIDGEANEAVWDLALEVPVLENWSSFGAFETPDPDLDVVARILWSEDTLYVYMRAFDNAIFTPDAGDAWQADQFLIGIDPTHEGDSLYDADFSGAPANAPDMGPYAYKVWPGGITLNWGFDGIDPVAEGWVNGVVVVDEANLEWGFEAAFYVPQIDPGGQIGFNVGGAQASQEAIDAGADEATYAFYSWLVCPNPTEDSFCQYAGGNVMSDARSFTTLEFGAGGGGGETTTYGAGVSRDVPEVDPSEMVMDGVADEAAWANALEVNALENWSSFGAFETPDPDMETETKILFSRDTLYVYYRVLDNAIYIPDAGDAWQSDQILVGIDATYAGDELYDSDFSGAPANAPNGPTAYKIWPEGITLNWGFDEIDPVAEGWVNGTVFVDQANLEWGFEAAFYVPDAISGSRIGFNIGGAQASQEALDAGADEATYAFYSWLVCPNPTEDSFCQYAGGNVMSDARSFGTLWLGGPYGVNEVIQVAPVSASEITLDGQADEAAWETATVVNALENWSSFGAFETPDPDMETETKLLWSEGTLYVYYRVLDNSIFIPEDPGDAWQSDQILVGIDPTHAGDHLYDSDFSGAPANAPDKGPYAYKVWPEGITLNWGFDEIDPVAEGWADGVVFVDEQNLEWGFEAAFSVPQIQTGARIGFNIGGAQASQEALDAGADEATYAFYSWRVCPNPTEDSFCQYAGGNVMSDARSFATLSFVVNVGIEKEKLAGEVPSSFVLEQNYPNPFNPATTIEFGLTRAGNVSLDVFNLLGQKLATLVNEPYQAGTYRVNWSAGDLSSGVYLYQLRVDGAIVATKRMMLVK